MASSRVLWPALLCLPKPYIPYLATPCSFSYLPNQSALFSAFITNGCSDAFSTTYVQSRYLARSRNIPRPCVGQRGFWTVIEPWSGQLSCSVNFCRANSAPTLTPHAQKWLPSAGTSVQSIWRGLALALRGSVCAPPAEGPVPLWWLPGT